MTYKVSVTVEVVPSYAKFIAFLAWLYESEEGDDIEYWADDIIHAMLVLRDHAWDLFPVEEMRKLYDGFSNKHFEKMLEFSHSQPPA